MILAEAARRQRDGRLGPALDSLAEAAALADGDDAELAALREAIHGELAARGVAWVPAGAARLGERAAARSVWVKEVYVDVHEVTHEVYARFVATGGAKPLATWGGPTPPPELAPLPVTGVTPRQAAAFAAWRGGRLPTPAEWEKAARGPGGATWPWGDEPDPAACNWAGAGHGRPLLPGAMPRDASPYGVLDLAGNVAELALDGTGAVAAEVRGGSFLTRWLPGTRAAFAQELPMDEAHPAVGFRCVHDAPPERSR
ncbi:MAG: SUMF1/EgtB/PvdO family nonheme iron enzyme [Planctomycetes bacterium]|nr:SUMF1/EgtB/PvdO family nonheme iron enzyme [Planctomycetota bacterium]